MIPSFPKLDDNIHIFLHTSSLIWQQPGKLTPSAHAYLHTASGGIIQTSPNTPKVKGDYLCNSHLPISELQVYLGVGGG